MAAPRASGDARAPPEGNPTRAQGILLSGVAGAVDGIGFVLLHVFTAHVTGNTVHVGTGLGRLRLRDAGHAGFAIAAFVAGAAAGAALRDASRRRGLPARAVVLGACAGLLAAFLAVGSAWHLGTGRASGSPFFVLAGLAALTMGAQNTVTPSVGGRRARTYITGTMTQFAEALVEAASGPKRRAALARALDRLSLWAAYLAGGVLTGVGGVRWGAGAIGFPLGGLALVLALEAARARRPPQG